MKGILQYVAGDTVLHRMNPLAKLALAMAVCLCCFATQSLMLVFGLILLDVGMGYLGGVGRQTIKILKGLVKFTAFFFVLQIFFVPDGRALISLPLGIRITDQGLRFSLLLCMRIIGATLPLTIVLMTTRLSALTREMVNRLHVPYRYAFALTTAIRFIPILSGEMAGIMEAQTARGVEMDGNIFRKIRLMLPLCVPLLVSAVRRIELSAVSAELRGFHLAGKNRSGKGEL